MWAGGIRSRYSEVSDSQAGNCRFKKDLNRALGTRREVLTAVIFLREIDPRGNDLLHSDIRFRRVSKCKGVRRTLRIDYCFAEIDPGSRKL
jgi:hypothetical protein